MKVHNMRGHHITLGLVGEVKASGHLSEARLEI